ncbi:uncharacterized protein TRIADDRAFT_4385, partial [Trichoplax adhaerens]
YDQTVSDFPNGITVALAYGSGVFKQQHQAITSDNMVDFIFAVQDPLRWHTDNLARNPSHYSFLKYLGTEFICTIQESFGAKVYYNTLVKHKERVIKYGVISVRSFCHELQNWNNLYISGRLQKPVLFIKGREDPEIGPLLTSNLTNTLRVSLLMLPENFTEESLYLTIAGLSYLGDFRMTIGENRNKVYNIVKPNLPQFRKLYYPILQ